jgi:hypothetical protein
VGRNRDLPPGELQQSLRGIQIVQTNFTFYQQHRITRILNLFLDHQRIMSSIKQTDHWGPKNPAHRLEWKKFQMEKPHHHTSYSARLWIPKIPSRMTYDVSTCNNNPLPAKDASHQRTKVTSAPHSRSTFENEIAD